MKFLYRYRTKDNEVRDGVISAPNRDSAYARLKQDGIRPERLVDAPGVLNQIVGKGKRWVAIGVLVVIAAALGLQVLSTKQQVLSAKQEVAEVRSEAQTARRAQIYGDPAELQRYEAKGWSNVFPDHVDQFLSMYAIPARRVSYANVPSVGEFEVAVDRVVGVSSDDSPEVSRMKRMVNGLKAEARRYLDAGGTVALYIERLEERQKAEAIIYADVAKSMAILRREGEDKNLREEVVKKWNAKNEYLIDMGMRGIPLPEGWEELLEENETSQLTSDPEK